MSLPPVVLPDDEHAHTRHRMEWWYFIGHLRPTQDASHPGFTVGFVVLRASIVVQGAVGLVLFVDHEEGVRPAHEANRIFGQVYEPLAGGGFRFGFDSPGSDARWSIEASPDLHYKLRLQQGMRHTIDLDVSPGPAFLLGDRGVVDYGQGVELAYYARPHLPAVGQVRRSDGKMLDVVGHMWLERQWGDADYTAARWKYLLVHPSPDAQWIFFRLDHLRGPRLRRLYGCRMQGDEIEQIREEAIRIEDLENGSRLPVETRVRVTDRDTDLRVAPLFGLDQYYRPLLAPAFFEGASRVQGTLDGVPVDCWGMTEMANYEVKR